MSFLGGLFGSNTPDENYIDDQSMQADYRNDPYVGHAIDVACTVYDTMFNALKFAIRGKSNIIEKMDKTLQNLEEQCDKIVEKYKEILGKLKDPGAGISLDLSFDLAKDAFNVLNSNPILRRYVGEANYWALWDMLAVLSGQGVSAGTDIASNIKNAIKGTIYALISMTDGLMHFESYISQFTQFWGWLYVKEIWLPLTDSICPQVTTQYYYKAAKPTKDNRYRTNPFPGPDFYTPMPIPVFDQVNYSWAYIASHFSYDDPDTWDVLTPESRAVMERSYAYWKSNYTNAISANDLLSGASSILTGGQFTVGFGQRPDDYDGISNNTPLKMGATFNQLDTGKIDEFPVNLANDPIVDTPLIDAFEKVDATFIALVDVMNGATLGAARDTILTEMGRDDLTGSWPYTTSLLSNDMAVSNKMGELLSGVSEYVEYKNALIALSVLYNKTTGTPYKRIENAYANFNTTPLYTYLVDYYSKANASIESLALQGVIDSVTTDDYSLYAFAPYNSYRDDPSDRIVYLSLAHYITKGNGRTPYNMEAEAAIGSSLAVANEIGHKVYKGREPLFAALGVYGDLKGLFPWDYEVVLFDTFIATHTKIKGSFHIYYDNNSPKDVIFADKIITRGSMKYIVAAKPVAEDTVSRGSETYTAYIFPSETCSVHIVPAPGMMFGMEFPSFASLQRVDAVGPDGQRYMYDLTTNVIPRYPIHVDAEKWSIMDLIHELWLLADSLEPICGDGGERKAQLNDLLNQFGLHVLHTYTDGPQFIGQLPPDNGEHVELEFKTMNDFAGRIRKALDMVYGVRDEVIAATQAW